MILIVKPRFSDACIGKKFTLLNKFKKNRLLQSRHTNSCETGYRNISTIFRLSGVTAGYGSADEGFGTHFYLVLIDGADMTF